MITGLVGEKLGHKLCLHKRLSARYRDTAVLTEVIAASP